MTTIVTQLFVDPDEATTPTPPSYYYTIARETRGSVLMSYSHSTQHYTTSAASITDRHLSRVMNGELSVRPSGACRVNSNPPMNTANHPAVSLNIHIWKWEGIYIVDSLQLTETCWYHRSVELPQPIKRVFFDLNLDPLMYGDARLGRLQSSIFFLLLT